MSAAHFYYWEVPVIVPLLLAAADRGAALLTVGRSKARAKGLALLAATLRGGVLEGLMGAREMDRICDAISLLLTGQVALLHVLPLPNNALDALVGALGSCAHRRERMGSHKGAMVRRMLKHCWGRYACGESRVVVAVAVVCLGEDDNARRRVPGGGAIEGGGGPPRSRRQAWQLAG